MPSRDPLILTLVVAISIFATCLGLQNLDWFIQAIGQAIAARHH